MGCPGVRAEKPLNGSPAVTCERASDVLVQAGLVPWRLGAPDSADNCQTGSSPRRGNAVRRVGKRLATFFGPYLRVAASAKALLSRFYHSLRSSSARVFSARIGRAGNTARPLHRLLELARPLLLAELVYTPEQVGELGLSWAG